MVQNNDTQRASFFRNPQAWLLLGLIAFALAAFGAFVADYIHRQPLTQDVEWAKSYPATDWVDWQDGPDGVIAASVLPPAADNPRLEQAYVQPGDRLLKIDYLPVYRAEVARELSRSAQPGTVLLYQLERPDPSQFGMRRLNQFVVLGYRPSFAFVEHTGQWWAHLSLETLALLITLLLLALVAPFLRTNLSATLPIVLIIMLSAMYFGLTVLRFLLLRIDSSFELLQAEQVSVMAYAVVSIGLSLAVSAAAIGYTRIFWLLPSAVVGGLILLGCGDQLFGVGGFGSYRSLWFYALQCYVLWHMVLYLTLALSTASPFGRSIRYGLWAGTGLLAVAGVFRTLQSAFGNLPETEQTIDLLLRLSPALPLAVSTSTALRFGNVSSVALRAMIYLFGVLLLFGLFMLTDRLTERLAIGGLYRGALEFGLLIAVVLVVRWLLVRNQKGLGRFIATPQQRRGQAFNEFIARMPRITQSRELVSQAAQQTALYLQADWCLAWPNLPDDSRKAPVNAEEDAETSTQIIENEIQTTHSFAFDSSAADLLTLSLQTRDTIWSRTKELAAGAFPAQLEAALETAGVQLLIPLRNGPQPIALLVGRRRTGVYSLSQVEALEPMRRQCRLTLEILDLLEKEKALVQQTLEANLRALRSQVNPHFLFNALNTIAALVHDNPDLAEEAIIKLSTIFRYTLKHSHLNFVRLDQELQLVRNYLEIEELRFGERLELDISDDPSCHKHLIPAFMLQTLVENALKHGVAKMIGTGHVGLSVRHDGPDVVCVITDNGPGIDLSRVAKGTGTSNTRERLQNLYKRDDLITFENTGNGTRVVLRLPPAPADAVLL